MPAISLKGVYKYPGYAESWHFQEWVKRTNPGIDVQIHDHYNVSVAYKEGRRRKLKKKLISLERVGMGCSCCGDYIQLSIKDKPKNG